MLWRTVEQCFGLWLTVSVVSGQLTEEEKSLIVEIHNEYRSQVLPLAASMAKMRWDENLRIMAENYAAKCIWDHNLELSAAGIGENLFVGTGPFSVRKALSDWFLEHEDYDFVNNSCSEDKMCGHYTQMVWAKTNSVGCASHFCETLEGLDFEKSTFVVCNYFPAGNVEEMWPYESGVPCSLCPLGPLACIDNLCDDQTPTEDHEGTQKPTTGPSERSPEPHTTASVGPNQTEEPETDADTDRVLTRRPSDCASAVTGPRVCLILLTSFLTRHFL